MANWLRTTRRPGRTRRVRTLTNNPERGSNRFGGLKAVGFGQRSVRRLMKNDPQNAQGTSPSKMKLTTPGMTDNGGSPVKRIIGKTESRGRVQGSTQSGTGRTKRLPAKPTGIKGLKKR